MKNLETSYLDLINGKMKRFREEFHREPPKGGGLVLFALSKAIDRKFTEASSLIEKFEPLDLNNLSDFEKSCYYETQAVLAVHADKSSQSVANLCRRALTLNESAFFARYHLAMYEARFDPRIAVAQLEILHGHYPENEDVLFTLVRMYSTIHKKKEADKLASTSRDQFRRSLYWLMMNLFTKWVIYTIGFALLIVLIYTPLVSWIFYGVCLGVCIWLIVYGYMKKDPLIFNFFVSVIIVVTILMIVKFIAFRS
jgi:hypothetical protein